MYRSILGDQPVVTAASWIVNASVATALTLTHPWQGCPPSTAATAD